METRTPTREMLDEVTGDMRLEYPGQDPFRADPRLPERILRRPTQAD